MNKLSCLLIFFCFSSWGAIVRTQYVMFKIPEGWKCKSFGVNWLCHPKEIIARSPFITTTADLKPLSAGLEFNEFERMTLVRQPKKVSIRGHTWLDSFHEYPLEDVLIRYERTLCCDNRKEEKIQILVGFQAYKGSYSKYAGFFLTAIKSLSVLTYNMDEVKRLLLQDPEQQKLAMHNYMQDILFGDDLEELPIKKTNKLMLVLFWLIVCMLFYILIAVGKIWIEHKKEMKQIKDKIRKKRRRERERIKKKLIESRKKGL